MAQRMRTSNLKTPSAWNFTTDDNTSLEDAQWDSSTDDSTSSEHTQRNVTRQKIQAEWHEGREQIR